MTAARLRGGLLVTLLIAAAPAAAWAQSPWAVEMRTLHRRYHENPARLDVVRERLEAVAKRTPHIEDLIALAQVSWTWGDIRATTEDQRLEAYARGREAAQRAIDMDPKNALAHFWHATNTARWGQTKGVLRSLFGLPAVKDQLQTVIDLNPNLTAVYALGGYVYLEVPALLGGDLDTAEEMFRKGLAQDARFTGMRLGLAKTLVRKGRINEARQELRAVLDEKAPSNPADWTMKDSKEARELLDILKTKSGS